MSTILKNLRSAVAKAQINNKPDDDDDGWRKSPDNSVTEVGGAAIKKRRKKRKKKGFICDLEREDRKKAVVEEKERF